MDWLKIQGSDSVPWSLQASYGQYFEVGIARAPTRASRAPGLSQDADWGTASAGSFRP